MTFELDGGQGVFHCDTCPESIETGKAEFTPALIEARRKRWKTYRGPDDKWAHACPSCAEDYAKEQRDGRK